VSALADSWLRRFPPGEWCDLGDSLDLFGELRDAIAPPTFSVLVREGMLAGDRDSGYLEASIDA
jgi:hypothetical protein